MLCFLTSFQVLDFFQSFESIFIFFQLKSLEDNQYKSRDMVGKKRAKERECKKERDSDTEKERERERERERPKIWQFA